jgi:shikimate kinase
MTCQHEKRNPNNAPPGNFRLRRTVVLVGLMGAGKTNVGKRLSQCVDAPFFDSDAEIEAASGMSVSDIFARHGEAAFRDAEKKVIKRLLEGPVSVIATGGGAYMNEHTRQLIEEKALSVWLRASLPVLCARTARSNRRPLLAGGNAETILGDLMEKRYPIYAGAGLVVDSEDRPPEETLAAVMKALTARGVLIDA